MNEPIQSKDRDPRRVTGAVLITIGLLLFVLQVATGITVSIMFLVIGIVFLAAYFNKQTYGLLVPGCILMGMGLGQLGEEYLETFHNPNFIGLGIGFLAIYVIDRFHRGATAWWPLIPGLILLFMGVETGRFNLGTILSKGWPLALVVVGLLYLAGKLGSCPGKKSDEEDAGPSGPAPPAGTDV